MTKGVEDPKLREVAINASELILRNLKGEFGERLGVAVIILTHDGSVTGTCGISQDVLLRCCLHTATHIVDDMSDEMAAVRQMMDSTDN